MNAKSLSSALDQNAEDLDFRHHLRDTIVLLGGKKEIADLLIKSMDFGVTETDILALRAYNADLIGLAKDRLANINRLKIRPK